LCKSRRVFQDLEGYQVLLVHLDLPVPRALPDQVAEKAEREPQVPLGPGENEAAED